MELECCIGVNSAAKDRRKTETSGDRCLRDRLVSENKQHWHITMRIIVINSCWKCQNLDRVANCLHRVCNAVCHSTIAKINELLINICI